MLCGRRLQIALLSGLLMTISHAGSASASSVAQAPNGATSPMDIVSVDPGDLVFDYSSSGTLNFSATTIEPATDALNLIQLASSTPKRNVLEQSPSISIESARTGDFVVPIPAIGIGWTLLLGAGMYRVGCKVLRVKH